MAHHLFNYMINALENKLVAVESEMGNYREHFNSWHPKDSSGKTKVFRRKTR